jgi:hypothetical protein
VLYFVELMIVPGELAAIRCSAAAPLSLGGGVSI